MTNAERIAELRNFRSKDDLFHDSVEFRAWLEKYFETFKTHEEDKWWVRDWMASAWDAALDAVEMLK